MAMAALTAAALAPAACPASGRRQSRRPAVTAVAGSSSSSSSSTVEQPGAPVQRRQLLLLAPAAAAALALSPAARAAADDAEAPAPAAASTTLYVDPEDKFTIEVPSGWVQGVGAIGDAGTLTSNQARFSNAAGLRRVVAFVPEGNATVSVAITVQFLGADFTGLGSFGTAQDFASGVVNKMDNSYILKLPEWRRAHEPPVQIAKLQDVQAVDKQLYVFSYTLEKQDEPKRTVYQSVAVGNNGKYNRFYTVNASATGADAERYGPVLQAMVASFRPPSAGLA